MKIALLAGYGKLPWYAFENIKNMEVDYIVIALSEESDGVFDGCKKLYHFSVGQVGKIIKTLKKEFVTHVVFAGKVNKSLLYNNLKLDLKALKLLLNLKDRKDDTIMLAVVKELQDNGIDVLKQTEVLQNLLVPAGVVAGKNPDKSVMKDIEFGFDIAKELGRLDIGQTVVVRNKAVMAVEAIEGTDKTIERGLSLAKKGGVVVKVSKPDQDERFDVPTVGVDTLEKIANNGGQCLAIEAEKTFVVDFEKFKEFADKNRLTIISYQR